MNLKKNRYLYMNHFTVYLKLTKQCLSTMFQYKIKSKKKGGGIKNKNLISQSKSQMWLTLV